MRMFDISPIQILMVAVIALLVFGPRRLPEIGRMMGRGVREFRHATSLSPDPPRPVRAAPPSSAAPQGPDADEEDVLEGVVVPAGTPPPRAPERSPGSGPVPEAGARDAG